MIKPNYLDQIDRVANEFSKRSYEERLLSAWSSFETAAQLLEREYDVLNENIQDDFFIRMSNFITLLYENGDGSPNTDCDQIREKNKAYGGSWCQRGGTGVFHGCLARKGDRLVSILKEHGTLEAARASEKESESIDDTIGDLRRYLILICAWHWARENEYDKLSEEGQQTYDRLKREYEVEPAQAVPAVQCKCGHPASSHDDAGCQSYDNDNGVCPCAQLVIDN